MITIFALGLQNEIVYGKWGSVHVYQAHYRGMDHIAALLNADDSPVAGQVISIASAYADSTQLSKKDGAYVVRSLNAPRRIRQPLQQAAMGDIALFHLNGPTAPFAQGLYLLTYPHGLSNQITRDIQFPQRGIDTNTPQIPATLVGLEASMLPYLRL